MINWKVRVKNRMFWLAVIPAALFFVQSAAAVLGFSLDFSVLGERLGALVEALFAVLAILGIVADPTTEGLQDSRLALTYDEPKRKGA